MNSYSICNTNPLNSSAVSEYTINQVFAGNTVSFHGICKRIISIEKTISALQVLPKEKAKFAYKIVYIRPR